MKLLKLRLHSLDILFWTKYQHTHTQKKPTWSVFFSLSWAFALASAHAAILNLCRAKKKKKSGVVIIQHQPLRVIDKVEWTNTLPKHATSHWASGTVIQNKQGEEGWDRLAAGVGDAQPSGGYLCLLLQQSTRIWKPNVTKTVRGDAGDAWRAGVTGQWSTGGEVRLQA